MFRDVCDGCSVTQSAAHCTMPLPPTLRHPPPPLPGAQARMLRLCVFAPLAACQRSAARRGRRWRRCHEGMTARSVPLPAVTCVRAFYRLDMRPCKEVSARVPTVTPLTQRDRSQCYLESDLRHNDTAGRLAAMAATYDVEIVSEPRTRLWPAVQPLCVVIRMLWWWRAAPSYGRCVLCCHIACGRLQPVNCSASQNTSRCTLPDHGNARAGCATCHPPP